MTAFGQAVSTTTAATLSCKIEGITETVVITWWGKYIYFLFDDLLISVEIWLNNQVLRATSLRAKQNLLYPSNFHTISDAEASDIAVGTAALNPTSPGDEQTQTATLVVTRTADTTFTCLIKSTEWGITAQEEVVELYVYGKCNNNSNISSIVSNNNNNKCE